MPTYPNFPLIAPTNQGSSGAWGTLLNACLAAIDAHRHEGVGAGGAKITPAGIDIDRDLSFASLYAPTNLHRISFASVTALSANNKSVFVSSADNELYWRTNTGTNVKLTSGNTLNISGFTGGFTGDYASDTANAAYDHSRRAFHFFQGTSGTTWARISAGELRIHEHGTTSTVHIALKAPAGLATTSTVTFPSAVPAGKRLVQITPSGPDGTLTYENTGVEAITMATNASVTLSGTGEVKHGDRVASLHAFGGSSDANWTINTVGAMVSSAAGTLMVPIPLKVGDRAKSVSFALIGDAAADLTTTVYLLSSAMAQTSKGAVTSTNPAASWATVTIDITDTTLAAMESLYIEFAANASGIRIGTINVTYDRP